MKKKPTILSSKTHRAEYKLSTFFLVLALALINAMAPLMASNLGNGDISSGASSDTVQSRDSFNAGSFEEVSHDTTSSNQQFTLIKEFGEVLGVLSGIAFVGGAIFGAYKQYAGNVDSQGEIRNQQDQGQHARTATDRMGSGSTLGRSSVVAAGNSMGKAFPADIALDENGQQKMINGLTSLLNERARSFVTSSQLSPNDKLNLSLYFFYNEDQIPEKQGSSNKKYDDLSHDEQKTLLCAAETFRRENFTTNIDLGLRIAEEQALSNFKKDFLSSEQKEDTVFEGSPEGSLSSSDRSTGKGNIKGSSMKIFKGLITTHIINNMKITASQKLDLLDKLMNPDTDEKNRASIMVFDQQDKKTQETLLQESEQREKIKPLLEKLSEMERLKALLNIGVSSELSYNQKLDLLAMATDCRTVINENDLQTWIKESQYASHCFFFKNIHSKDKSLTWVESGALQKAVIDENKELNYQQKWNLICCYIAAEKEGRQEILNAIFNPTVDSSQRRDDSLSLNNEAAAQWETSRMDRWKTNIQEDIGNNIGRPRSWSEVALQSAVIVEASNVCPIGASSAYPLSPERTITGDPNEAIDYQEYTWVESELSPRELFQETTRILKEGGLYYK